MTNLEWCSKIENERHSHKFGHKEYKPFKVIFDDNTETIYDVKSQLSEQLGISSVLVKYWLHGKSNTYVKYGIKKINYIK